MRYNETVHDTADFMADFIIKGPRTAQGCYSLGPPMYAYERAGSLGRARVSITPQGPHTAATA